MPNHSYSIWLQDTVQHTTTHQKKKKKKEEEEKQKKKISLLSKLMHSFLQSDFYKLSSEVIEWWDWIQR